MHVYFNMHRLRVISFDKIPSKKEYYTEISKNKFEGHYKTVSTQKTPKLKTNNSTNTKRKETHRDNTGIKAVKKISVVSLSELFRLRKRGNMINGFSSIKAISLDDIRKTLKNNVYSNNRRYKTNYQHHKNKDSKQDTVQKRRVVSQDDIKVLYSFERSKSPNGGIKDRKPLKDRSKSNYYIRRSFSDIFGIGSTNRVRQNTYLCFHSTRNTGLFPTLKRSKQKTESKPYILHKVYPLSVPCRKSKQLRFQKGSTSDHYNVVCFPRYSKLNIGGSRLDVHDQQEVKDRCRNLVKDQEVAPSPSFTMIASVDCRGDATDCVCAEVKTEPTIARLYSDKKKPKRNPIICRFCCETFIMKCRSSLIILKSVIKYILVILFIIAWSPCILAVAVCWLLVYPLKPNYVLKEDTALGDQNTSSVICAKKFKKKSIFSSIMEQIVRTFRKMASIVYDIYIAVMNNEECEFRNTKLSAQAQITAIHRKDPKTPPKWHPNPGRRYILFYDSERGWLMKPLRSEECEDCFKRPAVIQNLCFDREVPSRSNRAVTFSNAVQEKEVLPDKFSLACDCPPSPIHKGTVDEYTQSKTRETRPHKCAKFLSPNDIFFRPVTVTESIHKRHKQRKSLPVPKSRPCVICPPMRLCHPCPKRKKTAHKSKSHIRNRMMCQKCKPYRALKCDRKARVITADRPDVRPQSQPAYCSKATAQYKKDVEENLSLGQRFCASCKSCAHSLKDVICEAEKAWDVDINCNNMYIHTIKKRPCFWIYHCCRSIYPAFLSCHKACCNVCYVFLFVLSLCVWCPLFFIFYLCCTLFCGCCN